MTRCVGPKCRVESNDYSIHAAFLRRASRHPDRIAIAGDGFEITYWELARQADRIACRLSVAGVLPGQIVGLHVQRTPDAIAAILGVLAVGAAYLPFDPFHPFRLLEYLYEDSAPALMLVDSDMSAGAQDRPFWKGPVLRLDALLRADTVEKAAFSPSPA